MTKTERERLTRQENVLCNLGFTRDESDALRRISRTLRRWHELECGTDSGAIERDDTTGKPYFVFYEQGFISNGKPGRCRLPVADRERGALRRLGRIVGLRNTRVWAASSAHAVHVHAVHPYVQTDPRGAALYILRPGDVPAGSKPESCYTNGVCVY